MPHTERAENAFSFMMSLGISKEELMPVLIKLLSVYEGNWELIEDDHYRTLVDAYFDFEKDKGGEAERKATSSCHLGEKPTGESPLVDGDANEISSMDSENKMLCAEDNKMSSKIFEQKIIKPSQTFTEDIKPKTSSQASHSRLSEVKKISNLPRVPAKDRESYPEKAASAGHCGQFENDLVKNRAKKPKLVSSTNHNGVLPYLLLDELLFS
ncbi:unnamed protein product [Sphenostylis stenocarpa]|uniref:WIYLD domain-containing protein n=1 Tax=Sphenostylis stenocarpa TaxID=92480 RepID=A0AA86SIP8_9FABA|nr:unnamed protein product [Sphenostylis stenocarpa]